MNWRFILEVRIQITGSEFSFSLKKCVANLKGLKTSLKD